MLVSWGWSSIDIPTLVGRIEDATAKEHTENIVWIEVVLLLRVLLTVTLLEILFGAVLIIDPPLLWATQACESLIDFLESISSLRRLVLIRVEFQS